MIQSPPYWAVKCTSRHNVLVEQEESLYTIQRILHPGISSDRVYFLLHNNFLSMYTENSIYLIEEFNIKINVLDLK